MDRRKRTPVEVTMEVMVIWSSHKRMACVQIPRIDTDANANADTQSVYLKGRTREEPR
jgi:hypothetical protein